MHKNTKHTFFSINYTSCALSLQTGSRPASASKTCREPRQIFRRPRLVNEAGDYLSAQSENPEHPASRRTNKKDATSETAQ
jgi:hypothetical protein